MKSPPVLFTNFEISPIQFKRLADVIKHLDLGNQGPSWWNLTSFFCALELGDVSILDLKSHFFEM